MFEKFLKRTNWTDIVISILFVILGVLLIVKPFEMISVISILLGTILFMMGLQDYLYRIFANSVFRKNKVYAEFTSLSSSLCAAINWFLVVSSLGNMRL